MLRERIAAPDWDMWLTLAGNVLERLADAKDARRAQPKARTAAPSADLTPPPEASPGKAAMPERPPQSPPQGRAKVERSPRPVALRAGRRLNRATGVVAVSALVDSAVAHCRGRFHDRALDAPLAASTLSLLASVQGTVDPRPSSRAIRDALYGLAALTGLAGSACRIFGVGEPMGRLSWRNLLDRAPPGVPGALMLSGMVGFLAERVRNDRPGTTSRIFGLPAGRVVGLATSSGLAWTIAEAGMRVRQASRDPLTYVPVAVPPAAMVAIGRAALGVTKLPRPATRWLLRGTVLAGFAASVLRLHRVARASDGGRGWWRALINEPPAQVLPAFTGLALAGLAALDMLEYGGARGPATEATRS